MKKSLIIAVLMALAMSGMAQQIHYDFAETIESGQTLYFLKGYYGPQDVMVTYPCYRDYYANGNHITTYYYEHEKPVGDMVIPETITHDDTVYTITRIDFSAFYECSDITSVVFPSTLTFIGQRSFFTCRGIGGEVAIPDLVTIIGSEAFQWCSGITSVTFGNNLREIRSDSFIGCTSLEHISRLPDSLTKLGSTAFGACRHLCDTIVIPSQITQIEEDVFKACQIPFVVIPEGVATIKNGAFSGCPIDSLHIPSSLVSINTGAFFNCQRLRSITVDEANLVYDSRDNCNALIETATNKLLKGSAGTIIPNNVSIIGPNAFSMNEELESITIPSSVERLEEGAFHGCNSLSTITLPSSVSYIGEKALCCSGLTSIICKSFTPPTAFNSIGSNGPVNSFLSVDFWVNREIPIHIPFGTIEAYRNAPGWNYFSNFIEEEAIIYTDYEPDLCKYITWSEDPNGGMDSLDVDLDQDGHIDLWFSGYVQHGALLLTTDVAEEWEYCCPYPEENTLLNADTLQWSQTTDGWFGTGTFMGRIGLRRRIDDQCFYGWMKVYCDTVPTQPYPGAIGRNTYIDQMAYCTIPNYPLRWGQTSLDDNIGEECAEWYYEIQNPDGSITYQHLECVGDTLFEGGKRPKIIIRSNTQYDKDLITETTHEYIYQENGKVYWWNKDLDEFTTLYDFTANMGDEWEIKVGNESLTVHVDAVQNIEYNGDTYRMLRVSDPNDFFSGNIVCGIGHLTSFFPERLMTQGKNYRVEGMRCYWVDGELVFKPSDDDCDEIYLELHNGIEEGDPSTGSGAFMVYPNPAKGILFVRLPNPPDPLRRGNCDSPTMGKNEYRITNFMGQTLLQGHIDAENQQIDISVLPSGMYFITFAGETQKFVVR